MSESKSCAPILSEDIVLCVAFVWLSDISWYNIPSIDAALYSPTMEKSDTKSELSDI